MKENLKLTYFAMVCIVICTVAHEYFVTKRVA